MTTKTANKITVDTARDLCTNTVLDYPDFVSPESHAGLVATALQNNELGIELTPEQIDALAEDFFGAFLNDTSLQDIFDPQAALYFGGIASNDDGEKTWSEAQAHGEQKYADCMEELMATGTIKGIDDSQSDVWNNFSI